jgi:hypothetical protein
VGRAAQTGLAVVAALAAALSGRYVRGRDAASRQEVAGLDRKLTSLGSVDSLTILPVVERLTRGPGLRESRGCPTSGEGGRSDVVPGPDDWRDDTGRLHAAISFRTHARSRKVLQLSRSSAPDVLGRTQGPLMSRWSEHRTLTAAFPSRPGASSAGPKRAVAGPDPPPRYCAPAIRTEPLKSTLLDG